MTPTLSTRDDDRVLIAGAGPIGLICGYWLARKGISVHIVDRFEEIPVDLRASTWHPATLDMLEEHGVTEHPRQGQQDTFVAIPLSGYRRTSGLRTLGTG